MKPDAEKKTEAPRAPTGAALPVSGRSPLRYVPLCVCQSLSELRLQGWAAGNLRVGLHCSLAAIPTPVPGNHAS